MTGADDGAHRNVAVPADPPGQMGVSTAAGAEGTAAEAARTAAPATSAAAVSTSAGASISAALDELSQLQGRPVEQHVDVYERAHGRLRAAMADADEA